MFLRLGISVLGMASLACSLTESATGPVQVSIRQLPTLTPTAAAAQGAVTTAVPSPTKPPSEAVENFVTATVAGPDLPAPETALITAAIGSPSPIAAAPTAGLPPTVTQAGSDVVENSTATPLPSVTPSPSATATAPPPTQTPTASPTPAPTLAPWLFSGVQLYDDLYGPGLILYGSLTNNTGTGQELETITGSFFGDQGQLIAGPENDFTDFWPGYVISPGDHMPFALILDDLDSVADFELNVQSEPSEELPRQDFELSALDQWVEEEEYYCVAGKLRNSGGELRDYLMVILTLYDDQDGVISFIEYEEYAPDWVVGDDLLEFEMCADLLKPAARYELQAWGR